MNRQTVAILGDATQVIDVVDVELGIGQARERTSVLSFPSSTQRTGGASGGGRSMVIVAIVRARGTGGRET